jgi:hypothetical protein
MESEIRKSIHECKTDLENRAINNKSKLDCQVLGIVSFTERYFFLNLYSGGWNQGPLDTAAT